MLPRSSSRFVTRWIVVTLVISLVGALDGGFVYRWCSLAPARVLHGEIWRLVTWPLVEPGPFGLVLTCIAIYKFGGELAVRWGDRRLRRFVLELVLAGAIVTCLLAAVTGKLYMHRLAGWVITDVLVIAWARQFPERSLILWYGLLRLRGRQLIQLTLGVTIVVALYTSPVWFAPELVGCGLAAAYPRGWLRR